MGLRGGALDRLPPESRVPHVLRNGRPIRPRHRGDASLPGQAEAGEVALCFGWIDGQRKSHDEACFLQKYTPRRRGSSWSRLNVERAEALIQAGRMRPAGLAEIEAAKEDGRWAAAYESQRTATVPADLAAALARDRPARAFFDSLGRTDQYAVILRLSKTRSAPSRAALLQRVIALLRTGQRVN